MLHTAPAVTSTHMLPHAHTPALILPSFHTIVEDSASRIVAALLFLANYQCWCLRVVISLSLCPSAAPSCTAYLSFLSGRRWGIDWNKGFGGKGESDSLIAWTLMNFIDQYLEFCHFHCDKIGDVRHPKSPPDFYHCPALTSLPACSVKCAGFAVFMCHAQIKAAATEAR